MKRRLLFSLLLILSGAMLFLALRPAERAPIARVIVMPLPYSIPRQKVSLFDRWMPRQASWNWLWHLRDTIAGRPSAFNLRTTVLDFAGPGEAFLTNHPLPAPTYTGEKGLKIWLLSGAEQRALESNLSRNGGPEILSTPGISTVSGGQACLMSTESLHINGVPTTGGLVIDLLPNVHSKATDLTTLISLTEVVRDPLSASGGSPGPETVSVRTNFAAAMRLQVPKGSGVFVLQGKPATPNGKHIGLLLSINTSKAR
jgi:hypothetical protein